MINISNKDFENAVNYVNNNKDLNISSDEKLALYKYYKQATIGNINITKPSIFSLSQEPLLKYNAWYSVKNLSKQDAMNEYIKLADKYRLQNNNLHNNDLLDKLISVNNKLEKR